MTIFGWILWVFVLLIALIWVFSARAEASDGYGFTLGTCTQVLFTWLIAALFYFTTGTSCTFFGSSFVVPGLHRHAACPNPDCISSDCSHGQNVYAGRAT